MTDKEIVERAKEAEKRTGFGELVHSPISKGINSAYGIGFIEGMVEYRNSLQKEPVSEDLEVASKEWLIPQLDKSYANYGEAKMMELTHFDGYAMLDAIEFGAKWQKEQMMKGCFIPDAKLIEFKLGESYSFDSKGFDKEKAKAYGAKEGDTIVAYFFVKKT